MAKFWTSFKRAYRGRTLGEVRRTPGGFEDVSFMDSAGRSAALTKGIQVISFMRDDGSGGPIHLERHQVEALINHLESWLDYGTLEVRR